MLPTRDELVSANHQWAKTHKDINYLVSHHGVSEYTPQGTWCFYVFFNELMFQNLEDWAKFNLPYRYYEFDGKKHRTFDYDSIPELPWHWGATFGEKIEEYVDGREITILKIGCDYAHLWDSEQGYPYTLGRVSSDAIALIEEFISRYPQNSVCKWSGKIDHPSNFYIAKNGCRVHKSQQEKLAEYPTWLP